MIFGLRKTSSPGLRSTKERNSILIVGEGVAVGEGIDASPLQVGVESVIPTPAPSQAVRSLDAGEVSEEVDEGVVTWRRSCLGDEDCGN